MSETGALTGAQLRAARAMLRWEQRQLSERSGVPVPTIKRLEGAAGPVRGTYDNVTRIRGAFEQAGVEFIDGGVRLKEQA